MPRHGRSRGWTGIESCLPTVTALESYWRTRLTRVQTCIAGNPSRRRASGVFGGTATAALGTGDPAARGGPIGRHQEPPRPQESPAGLGLLSLRQRDDHQQSQDADHALGPAAPGHHQPDEEQRLGPAGELAWARGAHVGGNHRGRFRPRQQGLRGQASRDAASARLRLLAQGRRILRPVSRAHRIPDAVPQAGRANHPRHGCAGRSDGARRHAELRERRGETRNREGRRQGQSRIRARHDEQSLRRARPLHGHERAGLAAALSPS